MEFHGNSMEHSTWNPMDGKFHMFAPPPTNSTGYKNGTAILQDRSKSTKRNTTNDNELQN